LVIKAVSRREYSGDALVSKRNSKLKDLPKGSTIATGSLRRKAQLLNYRSDFQIVPIRGNLETRLNKFDSSDYDGMIMAYVGLNRLGYEERVAEVLPPEIMLPSAGQGVIAVVIREGDSEMSVLLEHLEDKPTRIAVTAEREFLNFLGGGCHIPVGVLGTVQNKRLILKGMISDLNGEKMVSGEVEGDWSESSALGRELAGKLLDAGGQEILESVKRRY
ncbi:MAG: hydroxymethylbilane synthase, partial [Fidelibacterota bacterium]